MKKSWINNKSILITGASSGIGRELVKKFIFNNDCKVLGIARNEQKMQDLMLELGDKKSNFTYKLLDISVEDSWIALKNSIDFDIDIIINNAGVLPPFSSFDRFIVDKENCDDVHKVINTNFMSAVYSVAHLSEKIEKSKTPAIINIASSAGLCALPGISIYSASKSALKNFTESIMLERNYYISYICPGFTLTDIFRNQTRNYDSKLIKMISTPLNKMSNKIYKGISKKKKRMVFGFDAKVMDWSYRHFPKLSLKIFRSVMNRANIDLFKDIF